VLAWVSGQPPMGSTPFPQWGGLALPGLWLSDIVTGLSGGAVIGYLSVIIPMGLFNVVGSLQNIESAEAAGDSFPTAPSLAVNGVGTIVAALCGSCFPTTIYIGHPGWKALGARSGYSILNGIFMALLCLTGTLAMLAWTVPVEAGMAIVIWIGIVISAQAFQATPKAHAPAVVIGLLPGIAAWGVLLAKAALHTAGMGNPGGPPFDDSLIPGFLTQGQYMHGGFALEQGFIFTSIVWAALTVAIIEKTFRSAAAWSMLGALLSLMGLMHSYKFTPGDTMVDLVPAWPWVGGYLAMAVVLLVAPYVTDPDEGGGHGVASGEDEERE
jgi:AGZA family xanthine/uracil permease-like MFS transporter